MSSYCRERYRGVVKVSAAAWVSRVHVRFFALTYFAISLLSRNADSSESSGGEFSRSTLIRHDILSFFAIHRVTAARARSCLRREPSAELDMCQQGICHHNPSKSSNKGRECGVFHLPNPCALVIIVMQLPLTSTRCVFVRVQHHGPAT